MTNKNISEKDKEELEGVIEEIQALLAGDDKMNVKEIFELRRHIESKVDVEKPDSELTPSEQLWKIIHKSVDDLLSKSMGPDKKQYTDKLAKDIKEISIYQIKLASLIEHSNKIDYLLFQQMALLGVATDTSNNNEYSRREKILTDAMLDKNLINEKRIENANAVLKLADVYEKISADKLKEIIIELSEEFSIFEKELEKYSDIEVEGITPVKEDYKKWLELSQESYLAHILATNSITKRIETDRILPRAVIKNKGNISNNFSEQETNEFAQNIATYTVLLQKANEKEEKLRKELEPLRKKIFGDNIDNDLSEKFSREQNNNNQSPIIKVYNPLEDKAWFRFAKVVYIGLWVIGFGFVALMAYAEESFWTLIAGSIIVWVILSILKKTFYYIILGRSN